MLRLVAIASGLLLPTLVAAQEPSCIVSSTPQAFTDITVRPEGVPTFTLKLQRVPVTHHVLMRPANPAKVSVAGVLVFEADAPRDQLPFRSSRGLSLANATVQAPIGSALGSVRATAHGVLADVTLGVGVVARGLTLPCDTITFDDHAPPGPPNDVANHDHMLRRGQLRLHHTPGSANPVRITVAHRHLLRFEIIERARGWLRVNGVTDHARITGYVQRRALVPWRDLPIEDELGMGGLCGCGRGQASYRGPAVVAANTEVFATNGGRGRWAKTARQATFEVRVVENSAWVQLERIEGIRTTECCNNLPAYVPRSAVSIPSTAPTP